ncbi:matrin 3-like 1.1 isoform 1-T4 [Clarias gariepinus]
MSQKYPHTNTGDDFLSHQDMYADSYQRLSNTYQPTVRASSQEQPCSTTSSNRTVDSLFHLPGMALSFLHSCGLDSSDLVHLAELPEHLITVETLPKLLLQIKERKLSSTSLSSSGVACTSEPIDNTSTHAREGSSHSKPVEYPIDRPAHPAYPLPPEQVQTWQDRWGNPRRTNTVTSSSSSKSSSVPDYSVPNYSDLYYSTTDLPEDPLGPFADFGPRPLLSLKLEPPILTPSRHEASDFNCKIPPAFPYECCLCDISVSSTKEWLFHVRSREHAENQLELVRNYPKWDQTVESARRIDRVFKVPTRKEAIDFNGTTPSVFPYMCVLCKVTVFSEKEWTTHITGGLHAKSQLELMAMYPEWNGTVRTARRNDGHTSNDLKDEKNTLDMKRSQAKDEPSSRVVSFAPLPTGDGVNAELIAIAKRFGSVRKSLFLPNRGFVEMSCLSDTKKLVERYSASPLKLKGKLIQVTFSCEYNSLRDTEVNEQSFHKHSRSSPSRHKLQRHSPSPKRRRSSEKTRSRSPKRRSSLERTRSSPKRRRSSERTQSSTKRRRSSEKTHSSPKRRHSSERTHSSPKRRHSSERTHSSPKRRHSSERTHSSPKRRHSSERTRSSPKRTHSVERTDSSSSHHGNEQEDKDTATKLNKDTEEKENVSNNYVENTDSDDDLEGLEVLADDEELVHDSDDDSESTKGDQENLPSEPVDITDVHTKEQVKTEEGSPNADISEASNSLNEGQKIEEPEDHKIEEDHDFPKSLENCVTLEELKEENSSDRLESNEPKALIPETEETFGKVLEVRNLPSAERYTDTDFINIVKRYGDVTHHVLFQSIRKGFVEMVVASDAERIAADSKNQDIVLRGNILKIEVSEKYCHLPEEGFNVDDDDDDDDDGQGKEELSKESKNKQQSDELNSDASESSDEALKTDGPVGTEFVRPVIGYSCTLCNILYASEEEAKEEHCRSLSHREKVKEHKEESGCKK